MRDRNGAWNGMAGVEWPDLARERSAEVEALTLGRISYSAKNEPNMSASSHPQPEFYHGTR